MYTPEALLDIHDRSQLSLKKLLESCRVLSPEELARELPGFGYNTVREQLEHIIGAADYWMLVFEGDYKAEPEGQADEGAAQGSGGQEQDGAEADNGAAEAEAAKLRYPDVDSLEAWRAEIDSISRDLISAQTSEWLSTAREFYCWPGKLRSMLPAHIVLRIATHVYHHQGQVLAMCRAMGHVFEEGFDFRLEPAESA